MQATRKIKHLVRIKMHQNARIQSLDQEISKLDFFLTIYDFL